MLQAGLLKDDLRPRAKIACKEETKISDIVLKSIVTEDGLDMTKISSTSMCFFRCFLVKMNYIRDNHLELNNLKEDQYIKILQDKAKVNITECLGKVDKIKICDDMMAIVNCYELK